MSVVVNPTPSIVSGDQNVLTEVVAAGARHSLYAINESGQNVQIFEGDEDTVYSYVLADGEALDLRGFDAHVRVRAKCTAAALSLRVTVHA